MTAAMSRSALLKIFLAALALRWAYALALYLWLGEGGLLGADSVGYLDEARQFAELLRNGQLAGWQWLGRDLGVMPFFSWLLALHALVFGAAGGLAYVLTQGLLDAATCAMTACIAGCLAPRFALPAGIAAAVNPTQIVLAGLVYTDTLFLFFVAASLLASLAWLQGPSLSRALGLGLALGAAALTRMLIAAWAAPLFVFLIVALLAGRRLQMRHVAQIAAAAAVFALALSPILARSVSQFGAWALTPQGGAHLAYWVVPLVKEGKDGTLWERTVEAMRQRVKERFPTETADPFETSRRATLVGREALAELGPYAVVKAWTVGAAINLGAPAVILSPPVARLPRTGFYGTAGASTAEKIFNFLFRSDNSTYAWVLIGGLAGLALVRLVQLVGLATLAWTAPSAGLLLLCGWAAFVLAVNGPVASPKYRLPLEPVLCVFAGAGFVALRDRRRRRASR
jgi:4-amino-4-deoxy-L-arabinose transferase-like glycosyltransferase